MSGDLQKSEARLQAAQNQLRATMIEARLAKIQQAQAKLDVLEPGNAAKRKAPKIERTNEAGLYTKVQALNAVNIGRDLERNFTAARAMIRQFQLNVVGDSPKAQLNTPDADWNDAAADWFNTDWAKDCDSREDMPLAEMAQLALSTTLREGMCLAAFDDFDEDDGRLIFWEADQLVTVKKSDWDKQRDWVETVKGPSGKDITIPLQQAGGVVRTSKGRVVAYIVTGKHGMNEADMADVTIFPRTQAKLLKKPWRFNQNTDMGEVICTAADMEDIYEMRAKELQSAKVAASMAGKVTRKDPIADFDDIGNNSSLPENLGKTPTEMALQESGDAPNYERFEALTGGYMEYLIEGDDFAILDVQRPNVEMAEFFNFVHAGAGAGLGLAKAYTTLSADKSYTAFRGDMILTWPTFRNWQKWIERRFFDWVAEKAIAWAIRKGIVSAPPVPNWSRKISWQLPTMPQVDPVKAETATKLALKNGTTNYAQLLGPKWREQLDQFGRELEQYGHLPLSVFETASGAQNQQNTTEDDTNDEK